MSGCSGSGITTAGHPGSADDWRADAYRTLPTIPRQ